MSALVLIIDYIFNSNLLRVNFAKEGFLHGINPSIHCVGPPRVMTEYWIEQNAGNVHGRREYRWSTCVFAGIMN